MPFDGGDEGGGDDWIHFTLPCQASPGDTCHLKLDDQHYIRFGVLLPIAAYTTCAVHLAKRLLMIYRGSTPELHELRLFGE